MFRSAYEKQLAERITGEHILALGIAHPDPFTAIRPEVSYRVRACTRYSIEDNQRIEIFVELARGAGSQASTDVGRLMGDLMFQSHWSYTECGLRSEATDFLIRLVREECVSGILFGAKITGGGGAGTVAVLGSSDGEPAFQRVVERYAAQRGAKPYVFEGSSQGADHFGVRTIKALQHFDVTTASTSLYLVPVFGVLLAAMLLGERLNLTALAGAGIVLLSTILVMRYDTSY